MKPASPYRDLVGLTRLTSDLIVRLWLAGRESV